MTETETETEADGLVLFETPFKIGATGLAVLSLLLGLIFLWSGFQEMGLLFVGPEQTLFTGLVGATICFGISVVAWVAAVYMEPGFDK